MSRETEDRGLAGSFLKIKYTFKDSSERLVVFKVRRLAGIIACSVLIAAGLSALALKLTVHHFSQARSDGQTQQLQVYESRSAENRSLAPVSHASHNEKTPAQQMQPTHPDSQLVALKARSPLLSDATPSSSTEEHTPDSISKTDSIPASPSMPRQEAQAGVSPPTVVEPSPPKLTSSPIGVDDPLEVTTTESGLVVKVGIRARSVQEDRLTGELAISIGDLNPRTDRFAIKNFVSKKFEFTTEETAKLASTLEKNPEAAYVTISVKPNSSQHPTIELKRALGNTAIQQLLDWRATSKAPMTNSVEKP
jgi:hypothetical protein